MKLPPLLPLAVLLLAWVPAASAQLRSVAFPVAGKFYMEIDNSVVIFQNGQKIHRADIGTSASKELMLTPGDRLVIHLHNKNGPYGFKLLFVSSYRRSMINFGINSYRVLRDPDKLDFTEKEFDGWKDPARRMNRKETGQRQSRGSGRQDDV